MGICQHLYNVFHVDTVELEHPKLELNVQFPFDKPPSCHELDEEVVASNWTRVIL